MLALTIDVPVRTTRSRESYAGLGREFRPNARMICEMLVRPKWLMALLRHGYPRFATIGNMRRERAGTNEVIALCPRANMGGAFSWEEVARYRDTLEGPDGWSRASCIRPTPRRRWRSASTASGCRTMAAARSRRWRRRSTCCRRSSRRSASKATVVLDSGIRSGQDVMRALALGANAAFAGKSFLWAVGALGDEGPAQLIDLYIDELRASLGQIGALSLGRGAATPRSCTRARSAFVQHERRESRCMAGAVPAISLRLESRRSRDPGIRRVPRRP